MKKITSAISAIAFIFAFAACTPENNNRGDDQKFSDMIVDLGIVMTREDGTTYNLYWAKSNLCENGLCANPEDYGDYYAWGETKPKSDFSWSSYKWCNGNSNSLTKYNTSSEYGTVDNKTALDLADDPARATLGGKWRLPNEAEWDALMRQCTWTWTTINGKDGRLGTAQNGNSIFLPAAGFMGYDKLRDDGSCGYYWSPVLCTEETPEKAYGTYFHSTHYYWTDLNRCYGFSVRPVSE